jgi:hypothetical protein
VAGAGDIVQFNERKGEPLMKATWFVLAATIAMVMGIAALPATADGLENVICQESGNTDVLPCCLEGCGIVEGEKTLGDLLLVGVVMMGLATLSAIRK